MERTEHEKSAFLQFDFGIILLSGTLSDECVLNPNDAGFEDSPFGFSCFFFAPVRESSLLGFLRHFVIFGVCTFLLFVLASHPRDGLAGTFDFPEGLPGFLLAASVSFCLVGGLATGSRPNLSVAGTLAWPSGGLCSPKR